MKRASALLAIIFFGIALQAQAQNTSLGIEEAIDKAIQSNLRTKLSSEKIIEAQASLQTAWAAYNPRFSLQAWQYNRSANLAELGLSGTTMAVPTRIGPFFTFESNLSMAYRLYDSARLWGVKGKDIEKKLNQLQANMEAKAVTVMAAGTYILLLEAGEKENSSSADLALAQRLERQAEHLEKAGVAAGVDVTRAQTRVAERRLQLTLDQEQVKSLRLQLLRLTGMSMAQSADLVLEDNLTYLSNPYPSIEETIRLARDARMEVAIARQEVALYESRLHLASAQNSPTIDLVGSAGLGGNNPFEHSTFIHNVGINISWPVFDGGLTDAQVKVAQSRIAQAQIKLDDTIIEVEQEVRQAYLQLETAEQNLLTAEQAIDLAAQELRMSEDRFEVGLTNNVELLSSQEALTNARFSRLQALASHNIGLIRLASASGRPELLIEAFRTAKQKGTTHE